MCSLDAWILVLYYFTVSYLSISSARASKFSALEARFDRNFDTLGLSDREIADQGQNTSELERQALPEVQ